MTKKKSKSISTNGVQASLSKKFVKYVLENEDQYPTGEKFLESLNEWQEKALRVNKNAIDLDSLCKKLDIEKEIVSWCKDASYFDYTEKLGTRQEHQDGLFYIGDPSAMAAVECLNIKENSQVIDLCSAPGGKSIHALNFLGPQGKLISNEIDFKRSKTLHENISRIAGAIKDDPYIQVTNEKPIDLVNPREAIADVVIVDAPCSGEAMMRRSELARRQWSLKLAVKMAEIQVELLDVASQLVRPGGQIGYFTCTFNEVENENVIDKFLETHSDFKVVAPDILKEKLGDENIAIRKNSLFLYPHLVRGDGQSICVLQKLT